MQDYIVLNSDTVYDIQIKFNYSATFITSCKHKKLHFSV